MNDSQVTPPVNEDLAEYNRLYSEFLSLLIDLHNYHTEYLTFKRLRARPGSMLRSHIKKMRDIQFRMIKLSKSAEVKQIVLFPPKKGTPKRSTRPPKPVKIKKNVDIPGSDSKRTPR